MKNLTIKWTAKPCEERQQKLGRARCWGTTCGVVQILIYVNTPLGALCGNRQCKHLKGAVTCSVSYVSFFSTDQTIWLWHKWTSFCGKLSESECAENPKHFQTNFMYLFTWSQEAEQRLKATNSDFFFPIACFQCSLKSFTVTLVCSLFLAGRNWLLFSYHCDCGVFREPWQTHNGPVHSKPADGPLEVEIFS